MAVVDRLTFRARIIESGTQSACSVPGPPGEAPAETDRNYWVGPKRVVIPTRSFAAQRLSSMVVPSHGVWSPPDVDDRGVYPYTTGNSPWLGTNRRKMTEAPERMDPRSHDVVADRREELLRLFPEARTEDRQIDFDHLRLSLGDAVDVGRERYGMTWPGKADCFRAIQSPSLGTLRPAPEESVGFGSTQNLVIEGDNLEVLKLLQKSYLGKVKMIYIDPPYNTGNDFIYPDDYGETLQTYLEYTGQVDAEGRKFGTNTEADGRFHSRWLSMMYPRLYLARTLLRPDGAICISINDAEMAALKIICNEVFGEDCFVAQFVWNNEGNIDNQSKVKIAHEYVLCYSRVPDGFGKPTVIDPNIEETSKLYRDVIENSIIKNGRKNPPSRLTLPAGFPASDDSFVVEPRAQGAWPKVHDRLVVQGGKLVSRGSVESGWSSRKLIELFLSNGCVPITDSEGRETWFELRPTGAIYMYKARSDSQGHVLSVIRNVGTTEQSSNRLAAWGIEFPYPKPLRLVRYLCEVATKDDPDALIMDFFPGSGTTGHAVMELNQLDGGHRKFMLIQLPEPVQSDRYETIFELMTHRLRAAAGEMTEMDDSEPTGERGFRVFKLAESNFTPWDAEGPTNAESLQLALQKHVDHIREGRSESDLLYEILLKSGYELTVPIEVETIDGRTVYSIENGGASRLPRKRSHAPVGPFHGRTSTSARRHARRGLRKERSAQGQRRPNLQARRHQRG